jgi:hypothetical protein
MSLHNLARVVSNTVGQGTLTLGAAVAGCLTFANSGVVNGEVVTYGISDGNNSEDGRGTYNSAANTLTRDLVLASTQSGAKINCSGAEQVFITAAAEDIPLTRYVSIEVFSPTTDNATGDGKKYWPVPPEIGGMVLVYAHALHPVYGTTNTSLIQVNNVTKAQDMLSTRLSVDSLETGSDTAATPAVIDSTKNNVSTYDILRIDVDQVHTTPAKGLVVTLGFRKP